ncbi:MAG: hypothetical protein QG552_173 [Thermodesulfobacteriota bacterium]|nr:hypothetical protein [Thermodesulfobacteriota bacterium]
MGKPLRVLMVEDSEDDVLLMIHALKKGGCEPTYERVEDAGAMRKALRETTWDVVLCDYHLPHFNGLAAIALLKETGIDIPLIIVSGAIGEETAVECMRSGARDFFMKGKLFRLSAAVEREMEEAKSRSQRKQAEEALRESEKRFRNLYQESPIPTFTWRKREDDFTLVDFNRAALQLTNGKVVDRLGTSALKLYRNDPQVLMDMNLCCREHSVVRREIVSQHFAPGRFLSVHYAFIPPDMIIVHAEDQTERKRSERELRESEERYRSLFEHSKDAILLTNPDGSILDANPAACEMFGRSLEEIRSLGRNGLVDMTGPHLQAPLSERMRKGSEMAEITMLRANGDKFPVEITSAVFVDSSRQQKTSMIIRDITERVQAQEEQKRLEAQVRRAQRMEAISTLAGGIAHDFNNILSAVMGYAQLAQMKLGRESKPYADLKEVVQSANRAKLLIRQILAVGRSQDQERQSMQLKYIVKEALSLLRSTLPSTIEIRETYDKDIGIIDADPTQMHQVLMNLCTNAAYAMEKSGGILEVNLRNAEFGTRNVELDLGPGGYLRLTVSDTGCGMTPEIIAKIFEPYFSTKEKGMGTGLGLSVVHGIVSQHGGVMTVESEPGKGSKFHVYLPLSQAEEQRPWPEEETPAPTGDERILFIDDEAALARMGKEMLQRLGYEVTSMTSSIEALALFRKDPKQFDLVITDTTMPHMPGDILAQEMMTIRPDIPIIICTGHSERMSLEKAKEMGIKAFLMKPMVMRDLAETVRKALD